MKSDDGDPPDGGPRTTRTAPDDDSWGDESWDEHASDDAPGAASFGLPPRYADRGLIGRGGQGQVRRVWDHKLQRPLAVKILGRHRPATARRFHTETRVTIELSHPSIIPVYDSGVTADGRPWFAMKPVDGVELSVGIAACHRPPGDRAWSLRRLLDVFARVCDAVAYAHEQGVVHRDLKPGNVMVGRFGEVWVMDWGIARRLHGRADDGARAEGQLGPGSTDLDAGVDGRSLGTATRAGVILGTPGYMSPEQARGETDRVDRRSDVYALGAMLYAVLTGRRPSGQPQAGFVDRPLLEPLVELVRTAMDPLPERRPADADAVRRAVDDWLDGARRRGEARTLLERARALMPEIERLRGEADTLQRQAAARLDAIPPHAPEAERHPGWRLEDEASARRRAAAMAALDFEQTLRAAQLRAPDLAEADRLLAAHHRAELIRAEASRDDDGAARHAALLAAHDDGRHAAFLAGRARWTLVCDPPEVRLTLFRLVERDRRRVAEQVAVLDGPVYDRPIDRGSYLVLIEAPGHAPVRCPMFIERGGAWSTTPPGAERPLPIPLPRADELGPDDVYVPGGWSLLGGDPAAGDGLPRTRLWIDGFVIRRFPMTIGALGAAGLPPDLVPDGLLDGPDQHPVTGLDWRQAMACADAIGRRDGLPWRLPEGAEWEKAARGVDGRIWPWGDAFDPSRARVIESFAGTPGVCPVGAAAADESVYGVRDLVGGVREWCLGVYRRAGPEGPRLHIARPAAHDEALREGRGGCWAGRASTARPAGRFAGRPADAHGVLGFRLARSFRGGVDGHGAQDR